MKRVLWAVVLVHVGAAVCWALDPRPRVVYRNAELHYTIVLPAGWKEIPQEIFQQMLGAMPAAAQKAQVQFVAGFQHADDDGLALPYVLVQQSAAVPDSLRMLADSVSKQATAKATAEKVKAMDGLVTGYAIEGVRIDEKSRMVLFHSDLATPAFGKLTCVTIIRPGRAGTVMLQCYSAADRYAATAPVFEEMARRLRFDVGYEFLEGTPRSQHSTRSTFDPAPAFIFAFLVIATGGAYWVVRKGLMKKS
jgi:hypothetical protein